MVLDVIRALGRRWYVVLIGLVLTSGMVLGAYKASPPQYSAGALVLLLPPKADLGKGGNPFLELSGLEQPASIVATYLSSATARKEVESVSPTAQYEIGMDDSTRGPVLAVDVTDTTAVGALTTVNYLLKRIPDELARLQTEVGAQGKVAVGSMQLTADREAKVDAHGTIRLMIAAGVAGAVATGIAGFGIDGLLQRRRLGLGPAKRAAPVGGRVAAPSVDNGSESVEWDAEPDSGLATAIPLTRPRVRHKV